MCKCPGGIHTPGSRKTLATSANGKASRGRPPGRGEYDGLAFLNRFESTRSPMRPVRRTRWTFLRFNGFRFVDDYSVDNLFGWTVCCKAGGMLADRSLRR